MHSLTKFEEETALRKIILVKKHCFPRSSFPESQQQVQRQLCLTLQTLRKAADTDEKLPILDEWASEPCCSHHAEETDVTEAEEPAIPFDTDRLPDEVLTEFFGYLELNERCIASRVCF